MMSGPDPRGISARVKPRLTSSVSTPLLVGSSLTSRHRFLQTTANDIGSVLHNVKSHEEAETVIHLHLAFMYTGVHSISPNYKCFAGHGNTDITCIMFKRKQCVL